jgi:hypothetical protein
MEKLFQKIKALFNKQRFLGALLIIMAVIIPFFTEGDITASILVGGIGLIALVSKTEYDELCELKSANGENEEES